METANVYDVSCAACPDYTPEHCQAALQAVLASLGGLDWVQPGMCVGIKANLVSFLKPEAAATTHPQLLIALTRMLRQRGARVIVGDSPGGLYTEAYVSRIYRATGMDQVQQAGAELNHDFSQRTVQYLDAAEAKEFPYTAWLDHCDAVINFCKLKSHGMMGMSAGAKNLFGVIPGTRKPEFHFRYPEQDAFANMIVDLNEFVRPQLTICDAVVGMEGNGPTQGTPRPIGCVLASNSAHKLDLLCAHLIGLSPDSVPTLQAALRRGLIPPTAAQLQIAGDASAYVQSDFKTVPVPASLLFGDTFQGAKGRLFGAFVRRCMCARPALYAANCTGCGQCAAVCPANAITMKNKRPQLDRQKCIRCFCCQEFCPQGAMQVHRPWTARLLNR